jgi:TIR domain
VVFVSYSHLDEEWLERFQTVFSPLSRYADIDLWSDERIKPGENWQDEINKAMAKAVVAVLLVSVNFLDSDFIAKEELPHILDAAKKRKIQIL